MESMVGKACLFVMWLLNLYQVGIGNLDSFIMWILDFYENEVGFAVGI